MRLRKNYSKCKYERAMNAYDIPRSGDSHPLKINQSNQKLKETSDVHFQ